MTQVAPLPPRRSRREAAGHARHHPRHQQQRVAEPPPITRLTPDDSSLRGRHATTRGQNFARVAGWTVAGSLLPGVGLIVAGRRTAGRFLLWLVVLAAAGAGALVVLGDPVALAGRVLASPDKLRMVTLACGVLALLWAVLVLVTHTSLRRYADLTTPQRWLSLLLVTALIGLGVVPAAGAGLYAMDTRDTIQTLFRDGEPKLRGDAQRPAQGVQDPWAGIPRVNVLLIGSDEGTGRISTRPDTLIVASIDPGSGDTVLFSLPRNLQRVPFPPDSPQAEEFPEGFVCANADGKNTECLLNGIWVWAESNKARYYPGEANAGLKATVQAVEQVLGLRIDNYASVNLRGFVQFVNAIGGLRINVTQRLPIGGSTENPVAKDHIEPGRNQLLNGYEALWYARSRWSTSDFDRMRRQRCVIAAVTRQADPAKVALNLPKILRVARDNIRTDIPLNDLDAWVTLTLRVKSGQVRSLPFTDAVISTTRPDYDKIRELVATALKPRKAAPATPRASATKKPGTTPSARPTDAGEAQNVDEVC